MDKMVKQTTNSSAFYVTTALAYLSLGLLALSPIAIIWFAAGWLHSLFQQSSTFLADQPRLYTVLTIVAIASALTIVADKIYQHIKARRKRELEHI